MRFGVSIFRRARAWARDESGSAVVDFAIMFPIFLMFMLSSVEMGMMTFRQTMLERGLDMAVRDLRLGTGGTPTHDSIKDAICDYSGFLPDCSNSLRLEMRPVNLRAYAALPDAITCVDKSEDVQPVHQFVNGGANGLMVLRACIKITPVFPNIGFGSQMEVDGNGDMALYSVSAFVNEPS